MQTVSMQDLELFSYWQEKRLTSSHCYDIYNPVISVELTELADRVVAYNDSVVEIQLDLGIQQLRVPAWQLVDVHERCIITGNSTLDYTSWVSNEITLLCLITSSRTVTSAFNKMSWGVDKYSRLCIFPMDV